MRMLKPFVCSFWIAVFFLMNALVMAPAKASAEGLSIGLAPVWWQYQETSGALAVYPATPFTSSVSGIAMGMEMGADAVIGNGLHFVTGMNFILPTSTQTETWNQVAAVQTNQFKATEYEFKTALVLDIDAFSVGAYLSYMHHVQERSRFAINGVPKCAQHPITKMCAPEPIKETIQANWIGATAGLELSNQIAIELSGAVPLAVQTSNDLIAETFTSNKGFRLTAALDWDLADVIGGSSWSLKLKYQYRKLGPEQGLTALWPENSWQTMSAVATYSW